MQTSIQQKGMKMYTIKTKNGDILYNPHNNYYLNLQYDIYDLEYYNFYKYGKAKCVEVSDELYEYLKQKSLHAPRNKYVKQKLQHTSQNTIITTKEFKPTRPDINFTDINIPDNCTDIVRKYTPIIKQDISSMKTLHEDDPNIDTTGMYIKSTDYTLLLPNIDANDSMLKYVSGTNDNATQVKNYLQKAIDTYVFGNDINRKLFVTGHTIVKNIEKHPNDKYILIFEYIKNNTIAKQQWNKKSNYISYIGIHNTITKDLNENTDCVLQWRLFRVEK